MSSPTYTEFLEAKSDIDRRSMNLRVWQSFVNRLERKNKEEAIRLMEVGAGTGYMALQLFEALDCRHIVYSAVEIDHSNMQRMIENLRYWAVANNCRVEDQDGALRMSKPCGQKIEVRCILDDILRYSEQDHGNNVYDALIGKAVLDLFDVDDYLLAIGDLVKPGGLLYFPITFDGVSQFVPSLNEEEDNLIQHIYHLSMDERAGDAFTGKRSQTGRYMLTLHLQKGINIVEIGSSDWLVMPDTSGQYSEGEYLFLHYILNLYEKELARSSRIDSEKAHTWCKIRRHQIEKGELIYIVHQWDVLAVL